MRGEKSSRLGGRRAKETLSSCWSAAPVSYPCLCAGVHVSYMSITCQLHVVSCLCAGIHVEDGATRVVEDNP